MLAGGHRPASEGCPWPTGLFAKAGCLTALLGFRTVDPKLPAWAEAGGPGCALTRRRPAPSRRVRGLARDPAIADAGLGKDVGGVAGAARPTSTGAAHSSAVVCRLTPQL